MKYYYKKRLPHLQPPEGTYFITYRLYGSIPIAVQTRLMEAYQQAISEMDQVRKEEQRLKSWLQEKRYEEQKRHFKNFDDFLDCKSNAPYWLRTPQIAKINADALHHFEGVHYQLWAYCIMSNHIHVLLTLLPDAPILWKILQRIKSFTARQANDILGRKGQPFWATESYDHLVRGKQGEFSRILAYILNNPVKAGIVSNWNDFKWSYCHPDLL